MKQKWFERGAGKLEHTTPFLQADLFLEYLFFCERTGTAEREGLVAPHPNFVR